jgi:hypothetical protein
MDGLVEVRQVAFERPSLDLACIPIRSPIAVGAIAVVSLQPLLILPLEVVLQDDAADLRALLAESLRREQISAIERGVVRQLPRATHACVELLASLVVAVSTMALEQAASAIRKGHHPLASVERHASHQPLISQVSMVIVPRVKRPLARIAKVAFGNDPKGPDRRERPTVIPVELVGAFAVVQHDLALEAAWQVEPFDEWISWVSIAVPVTISVSRAGVVVALARVLVPPRVVDTVVVPRVPITVTWIEAVEHTLLRSWKPIDTSNKNRCVALVQRMCA